MTGWLRIVLYNNHTSILRACRASSLIPTCSEYSHWRSIGQAQYRASCSARLCRLFEKAIRSSLFEFRQVPSLLSVFGVLSF